MADPVWLPTPGEVATKMARFLPARAGSVDGGFVEDASPTPGQVADIIRSTGLVINAAAGGTIPAALEPVAADAVAYRAAARVVASFFPEAPVEFVRQLETWGDELLTVLGIDLSGDNTGGGTTPAALADEAFDVVPAGPYWPVELGGW